jgi:predicted pyridoxine 5'-phosphate oxidase superfamily flavin-nucleotide-binding protein
VRIVDERTLHLAARPLPGDPLATALDAGGLLGLLVLDPRTRQRLRFNGRGRLTEDGVVLSVEQAYGNCPKYIQRRMPAGEAEPAPPGATRIATRLDDTQRDWIERADTLFIASAHPRGGADASHRGGRPGFVRLLGADRLAFDDYPGNGMFNTLGNLVESPRAGVLFVDFERGDLLQLAGRAEVGADFSVRFDVEEVRETPRGTPLRSRFVEYSPVLPELSHADRDGISNT